MIKLLTKFIFLFSIATIFSHCGGSISTGSMGGPSIDNRNAEISAEQKGDFFYGRRYVVKKTRFWGYLRKPGQKAKNSQLVVFNESTKHSPDRLSEGATPGFGFDQNYEYRIWGNYTGRKVYDINSNQFLPEFILKNYEIVSRQPGWLFQPNDSYNPTRITLVPR
jgi:hypothetical protein